VALHPALPIWYTALHDPRGVKISTPDPTSLKAVLYTARRTANDPALSALMIRTSPTSPATELWIIHTANPDTSET
jgi:hypothetical protein